MMVFNGRLIDLISHVHELSWGLWVYAESSEFLLEDTLCAVLDVNEADLGSDGFTPLEIEKNGYVELISMQDLQVILNKNKDKIDGLNSKKIIEAIRYYLDNDSYLDAE